MKTLQASLLNFAQIDPQSLEAILAQFQPRNITKGDFWLKSGSICHEMAFISSGVLRMYSLADGKEVTLWIGSEGRFISAVSSFAFRSTNYWNVQALTDCELLVINRESHLELCQSHPSWMAFDNALLAQAYTLLEERMFAHLHTTAQERFASLLEKQPALFNRVPLQYIASMLGVTPETLSRLRKDQTNVIS